MMVGQMNGSGNVPLGTNTERNSTSEAVPFAAGSAPPNKRSPSLLLPAIGVAPGRAARVTVKIALDSVKGLAPALAQAIAAAAEVRRAYFTD